MSITDATTNLSHTYTEQTTVAFTAGVLSDIDGCVSEIEAKLQRGTLGATTTPTATQVKNWLRRAKLELSEVKGFRWGRKFATVSTVATTFRYALPPDFDGGYVVLRDTTNDRPIKIWDEHWFNSKYPDPSAESTGEPFLCTIKNMELWLSRPADGTYTLEIEYDRSGAETTADDFDWLPEMERFRCCDFAIAEAWESLHDFGKADRAMIKWSMGIGKALKSDAKKRWRSMQYQAISTFQEYKIQTNQP